MKTTSKIRQKQKQSKDRRQPKNDENDPNMKENRKMKTTTKYEDNLKNVRPYQM